MSSNFRLLARNAGTALFSNIPSHIRPHKLLSDEFLSSLNAWVGKVVHALKNCGSQ